jgi:hypothetical protein
MVGSEVDSAERDWPYAALLAGESMLRLGRWQDCHSLIDLVAAERARRPGNVECRMNAMRGRLHLIEGRFDLAEPKIDRALELSVQVRTLKDWAWPNVHYAHLRAVELALALERHDEVEELVESFLGDVELYADVPLLRGELLLDCGTTQEQREIDAPEEPPRSHATLERAAVELRAASPSLERDRLLSRVELLLARQELAAGDLDTSRRRLSEVGRFLPDVEDDWMVYERSLLATLEASHALARHADHDTLEQARDALSAAFDGRVARLASLPERAGGLGLLHFYELKDPLVALARLDVALEGDESGAERALGRLLRLQVLGSLARRIQAPQPSLDDVRHALLADDRGLLFFLPAARQSLVLVVDREHVTCVDSVAGLNRMQRALDDYRGRLLAGLPDEPGARAAAVAAERASATELAQALLPPSVVERMQGWSAVTVSGLDILGPVPFGWLPLGNAPHLGRSLAWDTQPSIPFGVAQSRAIEVPGSSPRAELLLVGGVRPSQAVLSQDPGLASLPLSSRTSSALARPYELHTELTEELATAGHVLEEAPRHTVVQLLVHAIQDPARTPSTGLVLESHRGDSGVLWADALSARQFQGGATQLAVLASCRSAQGPLRRGDAGSADLAGAWLAAGVPAVLVSHSELTWGPMVELSEAFHGHLRGEGVSPAEALRRAFAGCAPERAGELPFRYGVLEVVGLGQRPIFHDSEPSGSGTRRTALLVGLGAAAVVAVISAVRRARRAA